MDRGKKEKDKKVLVVALHPWIFPRKKRRRDRAPMRKSWDLQPIPKTSKDLHRIPKDLHQIPKKDLHQMILKNT